MRKGCGQSTPQFAPHNQGFRNPPHNSIASAAVITKRSIRALSRLKSTTETKNSASNGIRVTLVIVVINSSLRPKPSSMPTTSYCYQPPPSFDRSRPELQAHSTAPERLPVRHQSNSFRWSALPDNSRLRLDSASQGVAPSLEPRTPA